MLTRATSSTGKGTWVVVFVCLCVCRENRKERTLDLICGSPQDFEVCACVCVRARQPWQPQNSAMQCIKAQRAQHCVQQTHEVCVCVSVCVCVNTQVWYWGVQVVWRYPPSSLCTPSLAPQTEPVRPRGNARLQVCVCHRLLMGHTLTYTFRLAE